MVLYVKKSITYAINKKNFDFIYVDGSHEYVDVKKDADEAFKIIKKGIIIFDDDFYGNINRI